MCRGAGRVLDRSRSGNGCVSAKLMAFSSAFLSGAAGSSVLRGDGFDALIFLAGWLTEASATVPCAEFG